jgi:hypothetical protein
MCYDTYQTTSLNKVRFHPQVDQACSTPRYYEQRVDLVRAGLTPTASTQSIL